MAKLPVWKGNKPLWKRTAGGIMVPMWSDEPCDCCGPPCPPCEGTCTSGWASGIAYPNDTADCQPLTVSLPITVQDTSSPPDGYCYSHSILFPGTPDAVSFDRTIEIDYSYANCSSITMASFATCCDPEKCGSCSDTTQIKTSFAFCCCYGANCVSGVPVAGWPDSVAVSCDSFSIGNGGFANACRDGVVAYLMANLPGSFIALHQGGGVYKTEIVGPLVCGSCAPRITAAATLNCTGLVSAGIGFSIFNPSTGSSFGCPTNGCSAGSIGLTGEPLCHGSISDPGLFNSCSSSGFGWSWSGFDVTW